MIAGLASSTHRVAITGCEEHKAEGSERQLVPFPAQGCPMILPQRKRMENDGQVGLTKPTHVPQVLRGTASLPRNGKPKSKWTYFKGLLEKQERGAGEHLQSPGGGLVLKYDVKGWRWGMLEGRGNDFSPRFLCGFPGWSRVFS